MADAHARTHPNAFIYFEVDLRSLSYVSHENENLDPLQRTGEISAIRMDESVQMRVCVRTDQLSTLYNQPYFLYTILYILYYA